MPNKGPFQIIHKCLRNLRIFVSEPVEFEESFFQPDPVYQNEASRRKKLLAKTSMDESRNGNGISNGKKILKSKPGF